MQIETEAEYKVEGKTDRANAAITAGQDWLELEAGRIREAADLVVPSAEVSLATAYWNGRREGFNSAREDVLANFPDRAKDLPDAIQVDQIRVRQLQEEQTIERTLATAR